MHGFTAGLRRIRRRIEEFTSILLNFKNRLKLMLSLIHPKYNILKQYALKLQRTKEELQRRVTECALFSKDTTSCGS